MFYILEGMRNRSEIMFSIVCPEEITNRQRKKNRGKKAIKDGVPTKKENKIAGCLKKKICRLQF